MNPAVSVLPGPFERGDETAIFGDVVRGDADGAAKLFDEGSVFPLDADAEAGGAGIAPRAAVDVGDDAICGAAVGEGERLPGGLSTAPP